MKIKFNYFDTDQTYSAPNTRFESYFDMDEVYTASNKPFDKNSLKPDSKNYLEEYIKIWKIFIDKCENDEYYDSSAWTEANEKFNVILSDVKKNEEDKEQKNNLTEYYNNEIRPLLKQSVEYVKYIKENYRENTALYELAKKISPNELKLYVKWIYNELKENRINETDSEITKRYLELFIEISRTEKLKISDFNAITLYDKLEELGVLKATQGINQREKDYRMGKIKGCEIIYPRSGNSDPDWTVYKINTEEAAKVMGSNTNWCTASYAAETYLSKCGFLIIFYFKNKPYAQLEPSSGEFKDKRNIKITSEDSSIQGYTLQDGLLYEILMKVKDDILDKPISDNTRSLKDSVIPAHEPSESWLKKIGSFDAESIHEQIKTVQIKRYKMLEPNIFKSDAPLQITEPYMRSWAELGQDRDPKLEKNILNHANWALSYSINVIKGPWEQAEPIIFKADEWDSYIRYALKKSIKGFLTEKLILNYKNYDDFIVSYRSIENICLNLKDYQRNYQDSLVFFLNLITDAKSADWLLFNCLDQYISIPKEIKITEKDNSINEIINIENQRKYEITDVTKIIYNKIKKIEKNISKSQFGLSSAATVAFFQNIINLKNNGYEGINKSLSVDANFNKCCNRSFDIDRYDEFEYFDDWRSFFNVVFNSNDYDFVYKKIVKLFNLVSPSEYYVNRQLYNKYGTPLSMMFYYFIYSSFYSLSALLNLTNIMVGNSKRSFRVQDQKYFSIDLLIEKAIINEETSSDFWTLKLLKKLDKSGKKQVLLNKRKDRDAKYVDLVIQNITDLDARVGFKKLLDINYRRTFDLTKNRGKKTGESFVEILDMLEYAKVPSIEKVKESFNAAKEAGQLKNITNSIKDVPKIISKFYKKNIGFIELFDMLDLEKIKIPKTIRAGDFYSPFVSKQYNDYYGEKNTLSETAYYLFSIKDIPDFKTWSSKRKESSTLNTLEKALKPGQKKITFESALVTLDETQYLSQEDNDFDNFIEDDSIRSILLMTLNLNQLSELHKVCEGLFIQYINLYTFKGAEKELVDKLILRTLIKTRNFMNQVRVRTYAHERKNFPGSIISSLLPYLATHHSELEDPFLTQMSTLIVTVAGGYVSKETILKRLIREIKAFNR